MRRRSMPNFLSDVSSLEERQERLERLLQMIGISPDMPYTVTVNDGTRNRVELGLIGADYGIKIVDNAGNSILLANGTIIANAIKSGTLDCSLITVANLNAGSITTGSLSASYISGGTLNCNLMTVSNLNAGSITVGTFVDINGRLSAQSIHGDKIQVDTLEADRIKAGTITADKIFANTITTNQLALNGVNADRLTDNTITNAKILSLSADKLTAGTLYVGYAGRPGAIYIAQGSTGDAKFYFQGGSRMWSDSSNRIGINSLGDMYIYVDSYEKMVFYKDFGTQNIIRGGLSIRKRSDGSGTDNLNVEGDARVNGTLNADTINNTNLYGNNVYYWNLIYWSDEKIKKNIFERKSNLEDVLKLKPIEFQYKEEKEKRRHLGFSAQEVEKVLPNLVHTAENGIKGINMTEIIPLLVGAIQELQKEVELLKEVNK